nr:hypothetical protein GCM10025730_26290 [Promicromonospora thailandica]
MVPGSVATAVGDGLAVTAFSGSLLLAVPVAVLAGLVSFASPCVLPLVPGYIGYVSSMAAASAGATSGIVTTRPRPARGRVVGGVALFVLGFTAVFVSFGAAFGGLGTFLVRWEDLITRVLGAVVILLGLGFLGAVPFLQREARFHLTPRAGLWGAPCWASSSVWAGRPASVPPSAPCRRSRSTRPPRAAGRCSASPTAWAWACPSCSWPSGCRAPSA